ncbi:MAG: glycosyltransferase, partial [Ignavibacteria bacterium]
MEHQHHRRRNRHRNKPDTRHERHSSPALDKIEREIDSIEKPSSHAEKHIHPQRKQHGSKPFMSIVIPLLNEEESLRPLYHALEEVLPGMSSGQYEVIFIDDGSTDSSFSVIRDI